MSEGIDSSGMKKLALTARELLRWKETSAKIPQCDAEQKADIARLERSVEYYKARRDKRLTKEKAGRSSSNNSGESIQSKEVAQR